MTDASLVREILKHLNTVYGYLREDGSCSRDEFVVDRRVHQSAERNLEIAANAASISGPIS